MAVSTDYATPVQVNGFTCKNCTDVAYAKRHIDPEHPKSGPFGVNADSDPSRLNDPSEIAKAAQKVDALAQSGAANELDPSRTVNSAEKTLGAIIDLRA
jgi:hypothetical protein